MKIRLVAVSLLGLLLSACASGPAYRPAPQPGDYGYRDTMLTSEQFRVSFSGSDGTARETVENFALFRAADVALSQGAERFRVVSRDTSPITAYNDFGPSANVGYGYGFGAPYWGTGIGYSTGGRSETRYETVLMIQIGPDVPDDGPNVYDASQIKHNLAPIVAADQRR
ncbi:hypothetical protein [Salinisphaera sp. Q1T1-3]|uniref:CC0125/CC1285 family lipoprotein n=1 Tax=Salinisphaera sp. Q1T1-3 TaxID=2321229 RepID=UPI000E7099AD|nr:hypothetical protein [Salinisphaera sp. Q1T1-3]RJS92944.1 hypothetical protein D3260_10370 [Salinisphaera sp. Q1T1-3]